MEQQSNPIVDSIYEYLKTKLELSEFEKDILDSIKEYNKEKVNRKTLIFRIRNNISKYNWLVQQETIKITSLMMQGVQPTFTPYETAKDIDLLEKLFNQILMMYSVLKQQSGYFMPWKMLDDKANKTQIYKIIMLVAQMPKIKILSPSQLRII